MTSTWTNWAGDQTCRPMSIVRPHGEEEVVAAVRTATEQGITVRAVGSGHSCLSSERKILSMVLAAFWPGMPLIPATGWVPEPVRNRPGTGVS